MKRLLSVLILSVITLLGAGTLVWTQEQTLPVQPPAQQPEQAPPQLLSSQQLNNLVAPIALYPDPLLGQILVASTYPLEVVEASQWLQQNKNLSGQQLMDAAKQRPWDSSVQALVAVPDALAMLSQDVRWTTDLGDAFLAQEADVMNAVQQMRARAQNNGRLTSTAQQTVTTQAQGGQQVIVIEPADPQVIYVPYYDPYYVWGPPVYGYYPPLYYSGFGFGFGHGFNLSFYLGGWGGGWGGWGWGPNWYGHAVYINHSFFPRFGFHNGFREGSGGRTIWAHDPVHRLGIPYRNQQVATRFRGSSMGSRNSFQAGIGSRATTVPSANHPAVRTGDRGYRNLAPQSQSQPRQSYQAPRYQAPQQRSQSPQQRYQAPQGSQAPQRYQTPQRSQTPQQRYQAPQGSQAPQRYQAPQGSQAPQRYQAPQGSQAPQRYQAPQRSQAPQQRYQAPQRSQAPQQSAPRFSSGGAFSGGRVTSGGRSGGGRVTSGGGSRSSGGSGRRR